MKKTNLFARLLSLLLVLCMASALLVACADEPNAPEETNTATQGSTEEAVATDENGFVLDSIPEDLQINETFSILGWGESKGQYYIEKEPNEVVKLAIYNRTRIVEDRLNVELEWKFENGDWEARSTFAKHVESTSTTGASYDALVTYNLVPYLLATQGLAENLHGTKYIDLQAPWWPSAYLNEALYNDTIYGLVESSAYGTLRQMTGVFFNNELIDAKNLESPYDMVENNTWTFDNMMEMIKETYEDRNDDGKKDAGDFYGITTGTSPKIDSWFFGMGYRWSNFDGDGNLNLLAGESEIIEYTNRLAEAFEQQSFYPVDSKHGKMFTENRAVMYMTSIVLADSYLTKLDMNYGIVPVPKGSAEQENYITHLSNTHDAWCVPLNADNMDNSSAVIECMASESYRYVDPIYFENCVKLRYAVDERLAPMYDLIRDSITFDFFYLFAGSFTTSPLTPLRNCCLKPASNSWSQNWASNSATYEAEFEKIVELYTK